jgi:hypothetical protein
MSMRVSKTPFHLVLGLSLVVGAWSTPGCGDEGAGAGAGTAAAVTDPNQTKASKATPKGFVGPKGNAAAK